MYHLALCAAEEASKAANPAINLLAAAIIALVSGTGGWATLQIVINRRGAKAEAARLEAEAEVKREQARAHRIERERLIWDAQQSAADAARRASDERYGNLYKDYSECRTGLNELREATEALIVGIDMLLEHARVMPETNDVQLVVTRDDIVSVRNRMRDARMHLN